MTPPAMSAPKRVGLNLMWLVPGVVGGSEEYTTRLLSAVIDLAPDDLEFVLFTNSSFGSVYPELMSRGESVVAPVSGRSKPQRVLAETTWLARESTARGIELMHHLGGIVPAWRPTPTIVTIHDLQPLAMPRHFRLDKRLFNGFAIPRSVAAARDIVTLTEFTKGDLSARLGVDPDRVVVVPPGFDPPADNLSAADRQHTRDRYGIGDRRFFLFPAITYPHKNHLMLLRAFARLVETHPDTVLVLTGGEAHMEDEVRDTASALGITDRVKRTGRIPAADIDALYREASALTFPSLYEGFGLPILEAMSRGCPVIAANATALPEVVEGAGLVLPASDPERWSAAMASVLDDHDLQRDLVARGYTRARHFNWHASATALADVYRRAPLLGSMR
jgi:glycosyltransferase involved in cell wall biosynthesis